MDVKIINNWKLNRHYSNGLWYKKGIMFPWKNRKYLHIGIFGMLTLIQWGSYK